MKELIKQLRDIADDTVSTKIFSACTAAADTIEDLQKKLDRVPEKTPDKWDLRTMLQAARAELEKVMAERDALKHELKEVEALREAEMNTAKELSASNLDMQQELNALRAELADEKYRHDRLQDFEVAESEQIAQLKAQLAASFDREIKLKKELERRTAVCFFIGAGR